MVPDDPQECPRVPIALGRPGEGKKGQDNDTHTWTLVLPTNPWGT
jgi:hypothetical protein